MADLSPKISISKFTVNDNPLYVKLLWTQNEQNLFEIHLFDGNQVWIGVCTNESAEKLKMKYENPESYSDDVKKCLTGEDSSYSFKFVPENSNAKFSWAKKFNGVSQVIGSVVLHQDNSVNKVSFLDYLIDENAKLRNSLRELEKNSAILNEEFLKCKNNIETFADSKISLENMLYGKFTTLLNAKKQRIQLLEDNLKNFGQNSYTD